jgi:hypothetical protein
MAAPANNPFPSIYDKQEQLSFDILAAFTNAGTELLNSGVTNSVQYLEIYYDGAGEIRRRYDDTRVNVLPSLEQLRLYPQLNGLFIEAAKTTLYP